MREKNKRDLEALYDGDLDAIEPTAEEHEEPADQIMEYRDY